MFRSVLNLGRKSPLVLAICTSSVIGVNFSFAASRESPDRAICKLGPNGKKCDGKPDSGSVVGEVLFEDDGRICRIRYLIVGLKPGKHGFHIHEFANFENGCMSAGPHFNPSGVPHGGRCDEIRHVGDLGNIVANSDGVAQGYIEDHLIKLSGDYSIVGRSVMVHADEDDLGKGGHALSSTTGNAGARLACGEVLLVSSD